MSPALEIIKRRVLSAVAAQYPQANGRRVVAIGRSAAGQPFTVTTPADWPTEDEIAAIVQRNPARNCTEDEELEARAEERRGQWAP